MRICFVSTEVAPVRGGGIGTYVAEAGRALTARGHEVWLLTPDLGGAQVDGFARVIAVPTDSGSRHFLHGGRGFQYAVAVHETLRTCGVAFDYIEFADYGAEGLIAIREQNLFRSHGDAVLAVMLHTPAYECYQQNSQLHRASEDEWQTFQLENEMLRDAPFLQAPSAALRDLICARLQRPAHSVPLVRLPLVLPPPAAPAKAVSKLADLEFVYFGRIEPRKGVANLIEAFRHLPELRLRLIGADTPFSPYGKSLRTWLERRLPSNVRFEGPLPRPELLRHLADPKVVCILPSRFENWPNACLEAMALGRIVIGSQHGGMAEMIEPGVSGFLTDGTDPEAIRRTITVDLAGRLGQLDRIGAAAAQRSRSLADPITYATRIEQLIAERRRPAVPAPTRLGAVSIVIPFFNDRDTVAEAVASALAQDHPDVEVLLVDDGSPLPDAEAILARCAESSPRVKVLRKPNGGLSSARNLGIGKARGDYVLMLDADNVLRPDYARVAATVLDQSPELGFVVPWAQQFDAATRDQLGIINPLQYTPNFALVMNRFGDAGACFRRATLVDHDLRYDEQLIAFEDWALWLDCAKRGIRGLSIPRVLYDYRVRQDSMMQVEARPNFRALIGLLIDRHLPADAATRELLWTLNQTWGNDADATQRSRESRGQWPLRYIVADKLQGAARKVPGLGKLCDWLGELLGGRLRKRYAARRGPAKKA